MTTIGFILTLIGGSWITSTAILGERRQWLRPFIMAVGLAITTLALMGIALSQRGIQ